MTRVVLGSASAGRRMVLRQAGIEPVVLISTVDEDAVVDALGASVAPRDVTDALARAKAEDVTSRLDADLAADCVVIGCDSMLYIDGRLRGKPRSAAEAAEQWQTMAGRSGELHTGHCVIRLHDNRIVTRHAETAVTTIHFAKPSTDELNAYIATGEPMLVAGGFTLDRLGGWFVEGLSGDPSKDRKSVV